MIEALIALVLFVFLKLFHSNLLTRAFLKSRKQIVEAKSVNELALPTDGSKEWGVSVIVCIRNGEDDWPILWEALRNQKVSMPIEVIVVDDGSIDGTPNSLSQSVQSQDSLRLRVYRLDGTAPGKKQALAFGVNQAKYSALLFTDVDCKPVGSDWVENMVRPLLGGADVTLGLSFPAEQKPFNGLAKLQALDALLIARSYIGWSVLGHPYMAVGRNWAMQKAIFPGFQGQDALVSGDDDMALQAIVNHKAAVVANNIDRKAQVDTSLPMSWESWSRQKRRHWSTAPYYSLKDQMRLMIPRVLNLMIAITSIIAAVIAIRAGVLHNGIWIIPVMIMIAWMNEVLNFRKIADACQSPSSWRTLGWYVPMWSLWNLWLFGVTILNPPKKEEW
ncbi:MAG: glycosyltransferase [Flavobacteriales bacterium]